MPAQPLDCEVLVVGAGPTGLVAANLLKRAGVNVRIVEQRMEATRESRAFAVQARTIELMQTIGLAEAFITNGVRVNSVDLHIRGKFRGGPDFARAKAGDTPFPFILMIPQSRTEAILIEDLSKLGLAVERGVTITDLVQDAAGVTATTSDGAVIRSTYVLGADGSRSIVRQAGGLGWDGELLPQRFLLADCKVEWPLDHESFRVFLNGPLIGLFLPLDGKRLSRVMATDLSGSFGDEDGSKPAPLDLNEMQAGLAAALNLPVTLSHPEWVTRYRAHHRFTDRYRSGRLFVAGDAAHIHSPAGGQGMNTGMQDAANLAWKLAAVLKGGASDSLLQSYDAERRPVGEQVVRSTGKLFAAAAGQSGAKAAIRDRAVSLLLPLISRAPPFHRKAFFNISQRAIAYPAGPYVHGGEARHAGPGMRAPDAPLADGDTLFDRFARYQFHALILSRIPLTTSQSDAIDRAGLSAPVVIAGDQPETGLVFDRYGVGRDGQATLLIRPDGYVAWRQDAIAPEDCAAFMGLFGAHRATDHAVAA